jgi:signal transduction histidine kinase
MREAFTALGTRNVQFFVETMNTMWFDRSEIEPEFLSLFRKKYSGRKIDLLMAAGADALDFAQRFREVLLPGVPIVFYNVAEDALRGRALEPGITGVVLRFNLPGTLDLAVRLQPGARRIVVVSGTSGYDRNWVRRAREALQAYEGRLEVSYWVGQPLQQLLENLQQLPADAIVLYLAFSDDGAGRTYAPADLARPIAAASAAPVYGGLETYLGQGIVGGAFPSFEAHGTLAGQVALRVLAGEKPENISVQPSPQAVASVDWRALQRWGINERRLPAGSVVQFRQPTIWQRYRWQISAVGVLCLAQTLLISGLLIQRVRRRRAEREVESLAGRLITAQEAERSRIANDLHDDVNQQLAGLSIGLSNVKRQLQNGGDGTVQEEIGRLQQRTIDLADVIRNLSHELHPGVLQHVGLAAALNGHCAEVGRQYPIEVTFSAVDVLDGIPQEVALCLYRVAQEALRNIAAHAAAHKAQVTLRSSDKGLEMVVADDGQGFDLAGAREAGGLGLISLDERVRLIGGSLTINTEPQRGTEVRVQVPLGGNR